MRQNDTAFACYNCGEPMENRQVDQNYMCGGHTVTLNEIEACVCGNCGGMMYSFETTNLIQFIGHVLSLYDAQPPVEEKSDSCNCGNNGEGHIRAIAERLLKIENRLEAMQELVEEAIIGSGMRLYSEWLDTHGRAAVPTTRLTDSNTRKILTGVLPETVEKKLCAYEDSGNEPRQVMELTHLYRKLEVSVDEIEYLNGLCKDMLRAGLNPKKLMIWIQAELEGRLDIMPHGG